MTELYVTGVVIANGIPDSDGDVLTKPEIKEIFTKYTVQQTDIQHSYIRNDGVDVIGNWITETPTIIGGKSVPAGSWLCTTKVTNEELCDLLLNREVNAYSLGSTPKSALMPVIEKGLTYSDVADIEDIVPLFISFVKKGANGYDFEVMSHEVFINKNEKVEEDKMTEKNVEIPIEDEKISLSALEKIKDIFGINKSDNTEVVEPETTNAEPVFDEKAFMEKVETKIAEGIDAGIKAYKEEEAKILEKQQAKEKAEEEEAETTEETKVEDEPVEKVKVDDEQKINKEDKSTVKTEEVTTPQVETNFYQLSGREYATGIKIKK